MKPGQFIVSKAQGMTLYGHVEEGCCTGRDGQLCITRFWKTPKERGYYPTTYRNTLDPFDRKADAPHWHRLESECKLYDFASGPLYSAKGKKATQQPEGK